MECVVRGVPFQYEEYGAGRPLLMLHGWPGDHRMMVPHLEPLFERRQGWRRLYPDLPGMGRTPGPEWISTQDDMLRITLDFLEAVAPAERFAVLGASYGGYLARGVLHERAPRMDGVLLWVPAVRPDVPPDELPAHQVLAGDPDIADLVQPDEGLWLKVSVVQTRETLAAFRATIKPALAAADMAFLERVERHFAFSFDVDALPEPFPAPVTILAGRQDTLCGYRDAVGLLNAFPRGTLAVLDRAGHGLAEEQAAVFRALVSDWLDRVEEYANHRTA